MRGEQAVTVRFTGTYAGRADQVRHARRAVARYLTGCPVADDAVLIVSELASNAVMCSTSCDEFFFVRVELNSDYVLAEVEDLGPLCHCEQSDGSPRSLDLV